MKKSQFKKLAVFIVFVMFIALAKAGILICLAMKLGEQEF